MKIKQNAKYLFTTPEGDQFIYFQNKKAAMLIEIIEHKNLYDAKDYIAKTQAIYEENSLPYIGSMTNVDTKFYTLIAMRIFQLSIEITQENADEMASTMRRLADWYRYTYLIPVAQGKMPFN